MLKFIRARIGFLKHVYENACWYIECLQYIAREDVGQNSVYCIYHF